MRNFLGIANQAIRSSGKPVLNVLFALAFFVLARTSSYGQCSPSAFTVTTNNLVVNTYYPGTTANVTAGGFSIALGTSQGAATGITKGDLVLIMQVQGSAINSNNGTDYGDGVAGGNAAGYTSSSAGIYEYAVAANNVATTGGVLYLTTGVQNVYTNSAATGTAGAYRYQVIRVPRYSSLTFNATKQISPAAWNGTSGGVVAFEVTGTMTVTGTFIDANAKGFRGGGGRQLGGTAAFLNSDVRSVSTSNGSKGEGIAGTPRYVLTPGTTTIVDAGSETYPNGSNGNGAPGNAGGGGTDGKPANSNDENSGGGGGGNGGSGGRGGKTWNSNLNIGGYGGVAPAFLTSSRLIFGGGGGAGSTNDGTGLTPAGVSSSGGAGGGLVLIKVGAISGTGTISANGDNGLTPNNDGGGGGGAGGTVYITSTTTAGLANITVSVVGGAGGNAYAGQADNGTLSDGNPEHGPGGGGGGGIIYSNAAINAASSPGNGLNGTTLTNTQAFGAGPGGTGFKNASAAIISIKTNEICDIDDDNDGIADINEYGGIDPYADADADGIPNLYDTTPGAGVPAFTDSNSDGISDAFDADRDGIINSLDLDSDNDGIADLVEAGGIDTNGDGVVDITTDTDGDGLADIYDTSNGGVNIANLDTDGDGIKNAYDLDSDNDGIPDVVEAGGTDANNDGKLDGYTDTDGDGFSDNVDGDVGNDGVAENTAAALITTSAAGGTPGSPASYPRANQDLNGLPNPYDLDADGDGILDSREATIAQDTNNDGVVNSSDTGYTDSNGDGWSDQVDALASLTPPNTDGTGKANYLDIDSDDDGIPDIIEGQTTAGYTAPSGTDTDGDGLDNTYDNVDTPGTFGGTANNGIIPTNTDGTDNPDYTDLDSDNDSKSDRLEGWDTNGNAVIDGSEKAYVGTTDTDGDGLLDEYDAISGIGTANNTTNNSTPASFPDVNNVGGDRDWRQVGTCSGNKLFNPSFELPTLTGNGNHIYGAGVAIPGWRVGGTAAFNIVVPAGSYVGGPDAANDGNRYLDITNSAGIFTQMFDLTCPSSVGFGGSFSSREAPGYINWTAKIEIMKLDGTIVATSTTRNFTAADADGNPSDAVWYPLSGASSGLLPAGRYLYKVTMGDYGNFDNAYLCVTGCYKYPDADGDLIGSTSDIDDDNDGIINTVENGGFDPYGDTDNDGIPNYTDATPGTGQPAFVDANGDGINDFYDTDKDGIINSEDLDSDNDGIPDLVEAGGIDTNGDGRVDVLTDTDGDGLANTYDTDNGGVNIANLDTDGDGIPNFKDLDSDNDGYPDVTEAGGADSNNDGKIDSFIDTDNDGLSDTVDGDVGNDGTAENTAGALIITSAVGGTPGRPASYPRANQDATGLPNPYDLDSDGDGILDIREANITDSNGDGVLNSSDTGYTDTNGDGWSDQVDALATFVVVNTDGRGKPNFLDIDSDDDGIVDNVEGQSTAGYIAPAGSDADGDGIDDNYDNNDAAFGGNTGNGITPVNTDGVDAADYLDLDSDNDGYPDSFEGHDTNGDNLPDVGSVAANGVPGGLTDADGDGLLDGYDNNTSSPDPTNGGFAASAYPNLDGGTTERDWREIANTDNVGGGNTTDVDDDNDGITDIAECGGFDPLGDADGDGVRNYLDATPGAGLPVFVDANNDGINDFYDTDQDGIINSLDLDSDNDGIADLVEAGGIDTNGDGVVDITTDTDGDGLADIYDTSNGGVNIANLDTDGDGIKNAYDLDSDNDGIPDVVEAGGTDANNDGKLDGYTDTDGDGFAQSVDGDANNDGTAENTAGALIITGTDGNADGKPDTYPRANTDRTGLPNPYDLDSDGDGILDVREAGITDTNNDGIADGTLGSDGWSDTVDALASLSLPNSDGRGPANYLDIDSDDDGITDNVEGQTTAGYILPTGTDTDGDGIDNAYDNNNAAFGGNANNGITPNNHDGLDNPDYTDTDSDNDGVSDLKEGTGNAGASLTITTDADGDGLLDQFDTFNLNVLTTNLQNNVSITGMGAGGSATGPSPAGSNVGAPKTNAGAPNRDWRNSLVVLAVNLTTFNAVYNANVTTVLWTAANEVNLNHYVVERSVDGASFQPLTTVAARGTGGDYSTPDNNVPNVNKVYYRLQLVTNDGHFTYSKVIVISRVASNNITVYPNPVKDDATINFTVIAAQKLSIKVYDAAGKTVIVKTYLAQQGTNAVQVTDWNHLAAGQYIIEVAGDSFKMVQRVSHNR